MRDGRESALTIWEPSPWSMALGIGISVVAGAGLLAAGVLDEFGEAGQLAAAGSALSILFMTPRRLQVTEFTIQEVGVWKRKTYRIDQLVEADICPSLKGQDHAFLRFEPSGALFVACDGFNSRFGARVLSTLEAQGRSGVCTEHFKRWALR